MAKFELAIPHILQHERGGFTETPNDEYVSLVSSYWQPEMNDLNSQQIANKLLDMMVLDGVETTIRILSSALCYVENSKNSLKEMVEIINEQFPENLPGSTPDVLISWLIEDWQEILSNKVEALINAADVANDTKLVEYWQSVKKDWLARASWNGL